MEHLTLRLRFAGTNKPANQHIILYIDEFHKTTDIFTAYRAIIVCKLKTNNIFIWQKQTSFFIPPSMGQISAMCQNLNLLLKFSKTEYWCNCICGFCFIRMAIKQPKNRDKVIVKRDLFTYENYFLDFYWGSFFMRLALT